MCKTCGSSQPRRQDRRPISSENLAESRPFRLTDSSAADNRWFVGGRPPVAAAQAGSAAGSRYFATVPSCSDDPDDEVLATFGW